jgi:hypothetical protein
MVDALEPPTRTAMTALEVPPAILTELVPATPQPCCQIALTMQGHRSTRSTTITAHQSVPALVSDQLLRTVSHVPSIPRVMPTESVHATTSGPVSTARSRVPTASATISVTAALVRRPTTVTPASVMHSSRTGSVAVRASGQVMTASAILGLAICDALGVSAQAQIAAMCAPCTAIRTRTATVSVSRTGMVLTVRPITGSAMTPATPALAQIQSTVSPVRSMV